MSCHPPAKLSAVSRVLHLVPSASEAFRGCSCHSGPYNTQSQRSTIFKTLEGSQLIMKGMG